MVTGIQQYCGFNPEAASDEGGSSPSPAPLNGVLFCCREASDLSATSVFCFLAAACLRFL